MARKNGLASPAAEIADHIRELDVHLREDFLHPLDAGGGGLHVFAPVAPVRAQDPDVSGRTEGVAKQAVGVELQQPLTLLDVSLAAGEILRMAGVDQIDLESSGL